MLSRTLLLVIVAFSHFHVSYACSMGWSLDFKEGIPEGYLLADHDESDLQNVIAKYTRRTSREVADSRYYITAPEIAENEKVVPLTIGLPENKILFSKIVVLVQKRIDVLLTKNHAAEIPNRNGQVPLNLKLDTRVASKLEMVASYTISDYPITELSMRLDLSDAMQARIIVLLVPSDKSKSVQVLQQQGMVKTLGDNCNTTVFVDGPMPKGVANGFYYF